MGASALPSRRPASRWLSPVGAGVALVLVAWALHPGPAQMAELGPPMDAWDYAYGAEALLHGSYVVTWTGAPRVPPYPPGTSLLMAPLVALAGVGGAVWAGWLGLLACAVLAAILARRVVGPALAPLAVLPVLAAPAAIPLARQSMSDLPSAAFVMLEALLLARGRAALAGLVAGGLVWLRLPAAAFLLAGAIALSSRRDRLVYLGAATPFLVGMCLWNWATWGSPFTAGYVGVGASPDGTAGSLFGLGYVFGPAEGERSGISVGPWLSGRGLPNALAYPLELAGVDWYVAPPGVGLLGLWGLIHLARRGSPIGKFGLGVLAVSLVVYVPYFWQAPRFFLPVAFLLDVGAVTALELLARRFHRQGVAEHADPVEQRRERLSRPA